MTPAHPARLNLVAAGKTNKAFAEWAGLNERYVSGVLNSRYPASQRFRRLLSEYLGGLPEGVLFPEINEAVTPMTAPTPTTGDLPTYADHST